MHHKLRLRVAKEFDELQAQVFRLKAEVEVKGRAIELLAEGIARSDRVIMLMAKELGHSMKFCDPACRDNCLKCLTNHYHTKAQAAGEGK